LCELGPGPPRTDGCSRESNSQFGIFSHVNCSRCNRQKALSFGSHPLAAFSVHMVLRRANLVLHDLFIPSERADHAAAELVLVDCKPPSAPKAGVRGVLKMASKWKTPTSRKKVQIASPRTITDRAYSTTLTPSNHHARRRDARIDDLFGELGISSTISRAPKADDAAFSAAAARVATLCTRAGPSLRAVAAATRQRRSVCAAQSGASHCAHYAASNASQTEAQWEGYHSSSREAAHTAILRQADQANAQLLQGLSRLALACTTNRGCPVLGSLHSTT
jgi:hypothetical protein